MKNILFPIVFFAAGIILILSGIEFGNRSMSQTNSGFMLSQYGVHHGLLALGLCIAGGCSIIASAILLAAAKKQ